MRNIDPSLVTLLETVRKTYESIPERFRLEGNSTGVLTRVVARLVPGLVAVDGHHHTRKHSWLLIKNHPPYIIDLVPMEIYPGPVIITEIIWPGYTCNLVMSDGPSPELLQQVDHIIDATEGAKRFLGMP
jgi:hypothetical protein